MAQTQAQRKGMIDMTDGIPYRQILKFSLPLLVGNIFQQLYNTVDSIVVGRFVGHEALAAVGNSFSVIFLLIALFMGVSMGSGIIISQSFGAKDFDRLKKTLNTVYVVTIIGSFALTAIGLVAAPHLLRLMQTPPELFDQSATYLNIILIGLISGFAYNMLSGILRGLGDSFTPLLFLIIACVINIVLDLLFVAVFGWGVAGVAWATVIAQSASAVFGILRINRMDEVLHINVKELRIDGPVLKEIVRVGLPSGIQQMAMSIGIMIIQGTINGFGSVVMAGYNAAMKIDAFCSMPMMTFGMAITTFVGQNIGARKMERIGKGTRDALMLTLGSAVLLSSLILIFGRALLYLFINDAAVVEEGMLVLTRIAPFYFMLGIIFLLGGVMRGAGSAFVPMLVTLLSLCAVRVPLAIILSKAMNSQVGIWWSIPIGWTVGVGIVVSYYFLGNWKTRAVERLEGIKNGAPQIVMEPLEEA